MRVSQRFAKRHAVTEGAGENPAHSEQYEEFLRLQQSVSGPGREVIEVVLEMACEDRARVFASSSSADVRLQAIARMEIYKAIVERIYAKAKVSVPTEVRGVFA